MIDSGLERRILIAMISSDSFLGRVADVPSESFSSDFGQRVAGWCLGYYQRHRKAPGRHIEDIFRSWSRKANNSAAVENVSKFLSSLSNEYDADSSLNIEYLVEQSETYFNGVRLSRLTEDLENQLAVGEISSAAELIRDFEETRISASTGIDPFNDEAAAQRAFEEQAEDLFKMPGVCGKFFEGQLVRDGFLAAQAPEKRGKTWWLIEMAYRALRARRRVAFFAVGDMSESQMVRRFYSRLTGKPDRASRCGKVKIPVKIFREQEESGESIRVEYKTQIIEKPLGWREGFDASRRFMTQVVKSPERSLFRLSVHSNSSINVLGIFSQLDSWERMDGFVPDVIVVDYADILAPENGRMDFRHQVNETWKALRRLSQEKHVLLITATQADADSYSVNVQTMKNFSEDKRKFAHVTGMFGLNQTEGEKVRGLLRLNWLVLREGAFSVSRCIYVGQCLSIGKPLVTSA